MANESTTIIERRIVLPKWLDSFIFDDLSACYCRQNKDMVVLEWNKDEIKKYLGTYFPRSYAESFCIFSNYLFKESRVYKNCQELSIFDFGCGTGGELIGFIMAVVKHLPNIKKIMIRALDGNTYALRDLECILEKTSQVLHLGNVQKITSAENLQSRASDEIVPFREFIIKDDTSALL